MRSAKSALHLRSDLLLLLFLLLLGERERWWRWSQATMKTTTPLFATCFHHELVTEKNIVNLQIGLLKLILLPSGSSFLLVWCFALIKDKTAVLLMRSKLVDFVKFQKTTRGLLLWHIAEHAYAPWFWTAWRQLRHGCSDSYLLVNAIQLEIFFC